MNDYLVSSIIIVIILWGRMYNLCMLISANTWFLNIIFLY